MGPTGTLAGDSAKAFVGTVDRVHGWGLRDSPNRVQFFLSLVSDCVENKKDAGGRQTGWES